MFQKEADKLRAGEWKKKNGTFNFLDSNWVNRANRKYKPNNRCWKYQRMLPLSENLVIYFILCLYHANVVSQCCIEIFLIFTQQLKEKKKFPVRFLMVVFGSLCNHLMWAYHQIIILCCDFPSYFPLSTISYPSSHFLQKINCFPWAIFFLSKILTLKFELNPKRN